MDFFSPLIHPYIHSVTLVIVVVVEISPLSRLVAIATDGGGMTEKSNEREGEDFKMEEEDAA